MASIFSDSWINQVFEGRNQGYGAYDLRKRAVRNTTIGMLIAVSLFVLVLTMPMIVKALSKEEEKKEEDTDKEPVTQMVEVNFEDIKPEVEIKRPPLKDLIKFTPPKIVKAEEIEPEDIPPPVDALKEDSVEAGAETMEGDPEGFDLTKDLEGEDVIGDVDPNKVWIQVEQMPEFPGGQAAMLKYLNSIPYPPMAKENDIQGSVFVKFVVDQNGNVTGVEVQKGSDKILNEAALAHVKKMPSWKAGKQNGQPVRVQYIVPIKFVLN